MDHADPQLEGGAEPLRHHLRGPDAQVMQIAFPAGVTQKTLQAQFQRGNSGEQYYGS